jgi:hypothetical protein
MDSQLAQKPTSRPVFSPKKPCTKAGRPGFVESPVAGPQTIKAGPARPVSNTESVYPKSPTNEDHEFHFNRDVF